MLVTGYIINPLTESKTKQKESLHVFKIAVEKADGWYSPLCLTLVLPLNTMTQLLLLTNQLMHY